MKRIVVLNMKCLQHIAPWVSFTNYFVYNQEMIDFLEKAQIDYQVQDKDTNEILSERKFSESIS